jgi:hypothetical protein
MNTDLRWPDAALAGLASSMRTFSSPGLLAVRGRISGRPRAAVLLAEAGEIVADKLPAATNRTETPALAGRILAGAYTGRAVAGPAGIAAGGLAAAVGTFATFRLRKLVVARTGLPDPVVALGEDAAALAIAAFATRPSGKSLPKRRRWLKTRPRYRRRGGSCRGRSRG